MNQRKGISRNHKLLHERAGPGKRSRERGLHGLTVPNSGAAESPGVHTGSGEDFSSTSGQKLDAELFNAWSSVSKPQNGV